jgi:hypothetical protein
VDEEESAAAVFVLISETGNFARVPHGKIVMKS